MTLRNTAIWILAAILTVGWCQIACAAGAGDFDTKEAGRYEATTQLAADMNNKTVPPRSVAPGKNSGKTISDSTSASGWWQLVQTGLALLIVVVLIFVSRFVLGRLSGQSVRRSRGSLEVLTRMSVSHRQELLVVRLGNRVLLVGASSTGSMQTLSEITDEREVANIIGPTSGSGQDSEGGDKE